MTDTVTSRSAPQVGSWSRLLLARLRALQLPWLRRWNRTGSVRRYHYLKLCLISSSNLHLKLHGIRFSDPQYPVRNCSFHDSVATIKNLNLCEFPALRVHTDIGVTDGPVSLSCFFSNFIVWKILPLNVACQVPTNGCRLASVLWG